MNFKLQIPMWSVITVIALAVVGVVFLFVLGGNGDASKEELTQIRQNQAKFSAGGPPSTAPTSSGPPLTQSPGAPPGGVNAAPGGGGAIMRR